MKAIHIGRGSIIVEQPPKALLSGLKRFSHAQGAYEMLYTLSKDESVLATLPGFVDRVKNLCPKYRTFDRRLKMPEPDMDAAIQVLGPWKEIADHLMGGGVISAPEVMGRERIIAAILKAYRRDALAERGTPLSVVACQDRDSACSLIGPLRELLPEREIGLETTNSHTDSDDIIIATYESLTSIPASYTGIVIGDDNPADDYVSRAGYVSVFRDAARWGLFISPAGGKGPGFSLDIAAEGLFGPLAASMSYAEAVADNMASAVTVCWLPAPQKPGPTLYGMSLKQLETATMTDNAMFVHMVSDILKSIPKDMGCILYSEHATLLQKIADRVPGAECWGGIRKSPA